MDTTPPSMACPGCARAGRHRVQRWRGRCRRLRAPVARLFDACRRVADRLQCGSTTGSWSTWPPAPASW